MRGWQRVLCWGLLLVAAVHADPIDLTPPDHQPAARRQLLEMQEQAQSELQHLSSKAAGLHSHITELTSTLRTLHEAQANKESSRRRLMEAAVENSAAPRQAMKDPAALEMESTEEKPEQKRALSSEYQRKKHQGPEFKASIKNTRSRQGNKRKQQAKKLKKKK